MNVHIKRNKRKTQDITKQTVFRVTFSRLQTKKKQNKCLLTTHNHISFSNETAAPRNSRRSRRRLLQAERGRRHAGAIRRGTATPRKTQLPSSRHPIRNESSLLAKSGQFSRAGRQTGRSDRPTARPSVRPSARPSVERKRPVISLPNG